MSDRARRLWLSVGALVALAVAPAEARTIEGVVRDRGPAARARSKPHFAAAGVAYPPAAVTLVALKEERRLELWAGAPRAMRLVRTYEVQAASGGAGPKLREGDLQVPEGVYRILWLNPNSSYHLSMKVDYPNAFDRRQARREGRTRLGGDIFIHGRSVSIGCIALGDPAIEELFVLASDVGVPRIKVLIAPRDLRRHAGRDVEDGRPEWVQELYRTLRAELRALGSGDDR